MYLKFQEWRELLNSWMILKNWVSRQLTKVDLSMGLNDVNVPAEKDELVAQAKEEVDASLE